MGQKNPRKVAKPEVKKSGKRRRRIFQSNNIRRKTRQMTEGNFSPQKSQADVFKIIAFKTGRSSKKPSIECLVLTASAMISRTSCRTLISILSRIPATFRCQTVVVKLVFSRGPIPNENRRPSTLIPDFNRGCRPCWTHQDSWICSPLFVSRTVFDVSSRRESTLAKSL